MPNHAKTVPKGCLHVCKKLVKKVIFKRARVGGRGGWPPSDNRANHSSAEASFAIGNWAWQQYEVLKDAYMERLKFKREYLAFDIEMRVLHLPEDIVVLSSGGTNKWPLFSLFLLLHFILPHRLCNHWYVYIILQAPQGGHSQTGCLRKGDQFSKWVTP